jgi:hypothetical protein
MILSVRDVAYNGYIPVPNPKTRWYVSLPPVNCDLEFGKVYQVVSEQENELWAFNLMLAGIFNPQQGNFSLNGVALDALQRRKIAWLVNYDEIRRFGRFWLRVKNQVRQGIKKYQAHNLSERDYLNQFDLTPQRYIRYLRQQSAEGWRTSCAIGVAHNRMVFCFPAFLNQYFIDAYHYMWVDMLQFMKSLNCLILIPSPPNTNTYNLCDDTIEI